MLGESSKCVSIHRESSHELGGWLWFVTLGLWQGLDRIGVGVELTVLVVEANTSF